MMGKLKVIQEVLKDCHLEFFYLLFMYGLQVQSTVVTQLVEDKICLNEFRFSLTDCLAEQSVNKTLVLQEASLISSYRSILGKLPAIATTLFIGSWINNYPSHLKFIITMPCISSILQIVALIGNALYFKLDPMDVLLVDLFPWFFGTIMNTFMSLQTYVVLTNPPQRRIIKFASIEVASLTGSIAGQYTGGLILDSKPWFPNQVHNYLGVFIVSLAFKTMAILFLIIKVPSVYKLNDKRAAKNPDHANHDLPFKAQKSIESQQSEEYEGPIREFVSKVFSLEAIRNLFRILTKKREDGKQAALLLLMAAEIIISTEMSFRINISYQFAQRAYGWSNYEYSKYHAIVRVIPAFTQLIGPRILIQKFGLSDIILGLIAIVSHAAENILTGSWLKTEGYIIAALAGSLFTLFGAVVRSLLSNIVASDEVGGVFSLLSVLSSIITLFTDWSLIKLFNASLSTYPGLGFHLFCAAALIPFTVFLWIKFKQPHLVSKNSNQSNETNQKREENERENVNETADPTAIM